MKEKKLLIVERCSNNLNIIEEQLEGTKEKAIVLTGVFTTFDQKNRNGRIYESADFLPHVEALKESIKCRTLLGEMDHPHSFETTLANASHVIESLEFDPAQNAIIGRIRLLNTSRGKDAQALVRDGIPLHISSRAAGTVNEAGKVRLQQLFTYDLVAEPGFANAVLTQVNEGVNYNGISDKSKNILIALNESHSQNINESFGFEQNSDVEIYEISEDSNSNLVPNVAKEGQKTTDFGAEQTNKTVDSVADNGTIAGQNGGYAKPEPNTVDITNNNNMDNGQYISYSDFQKYSEHLSEIITDLQSAIANYKTELTSIKDNSRPTETFDASKVDNTMISNLIAQQLKDYVNKIPTKVVASEGENVAEATAAMEEKLTKIVKYVKYLSENVDKSITYQNYLAENMNHMIGHQDYLAENMNKMIAHQDYLAENIEDSIGYQNYLAENIDKHIDYTNMLAEEQNKTIAYNNYLSEKMNQMVDHQDYLAENMGKMVAHQDYLAESMDKMIAHQDYIAESINKQNGDVIEEGVENPSVEVHNKTKKEAFNSKEYQSALGDKINVLIENVKTKYAEQKKAEADAIEESKKKCNESKNFNLINYIPARLSERWSKLSDERKNEILAESKMFVINSQQTAEYFWNTRDLREKQIEVKQIDEQKTANPSQPINEGVNNDRLKMMSEIIKSRMRRF